MIPKIQDRELAIKLRKEGKTYSEILSSVKVAKSTISLWLRDVGMAKRETVRITQKRLDASRRGGEIRKNNRIEITRSIKKHAAAEVSKITDRELWLLGIALYWAEGSKAREGYNVSQGVCFSNSDPQMHMLFIKWIRTCVEIPNSDIYSELYIHEGSKKRLTHVITYWRRILGLTSSQVGAYVYFKKHNLSPKRHNLGEEYYGVLRIRVRNSTNLNRQISGWIEGIINNSRVV